MQLALDAMAKNDVKRLGEWYYKCLKWIMEEDHWPEELFGLVLELLHHGATLNAKHSAQVPKLVYDEWAGLAARHRQTLLPVLGEVFGRFRDSLSSFCVAEVLGERLASADSLRILERASREKREDTRGYVAYGLRLIVENASDQTVRDSAIAKLNGMQSDASDVVRCEVLEALSKLGMKKS